MPELAEVEFYRKQWDAGLGAQILGVELHGEKRLFHQTDFRQLQRRLTGAALLSSEAHGKQMLFRFSSGTWLGLHLGMTGKLRVDRPDLPPGKHDHLVLYQQPRSLVFSAPRLFGRVRFHQGPAAPDWWAHLPPELSSAAFTLQLMCAFLQRHRQAPIKTVLLLQSGFPGVGNWMADEILWRARLHPQTPAGRIENTTLPRLWRSVKLVCRGAMRSIARELEDPPKHWLFHQRWDGKGHCPQDGTPLRRATIGGRTTAWCPRCQE